MCVLFGWLDTPWEPCRMSEGGKRKRSLDHWGTLESWIERHSSLMIWKRGKAQQRRRRRRRNRIKNSQSLYESLCPGDYRDLHRLRLLLLFCCRHTQSQAGPSRGKHLISITTMSFSIYVSLISLLSFSLFPKRSWKFLKRLTDRQTDRRRRNKRNKKDLFFFFSGLDELWRTHFGYR